MTCHIFDTHMSTVSHWKALTYGKYEPRGLNCCSTYYICKDILKSAHLHHYFNLYVCPSFQCTASGVHHTSSFFHDHSCRCLIRLLLQLGYLCESGIPSLLRKQGFVDSKIVTTAFSRTMLSTQTSYGFSRNFPCMYSFSSNLKIPILSNPRDY